MNYRGRFAPSPTGPLHAGSLAAALASWLDARIHAGAWLIRIEDVDSARCKPEWAQEQLQQLAAHGLHSDEPVLWQSTRSSAYAVALEALQAQGLVYACHCSRKKISDYWLEQGVDKARHGDLVYPGFCRDVALPVGDGVALRLDVGKALDAVIASAAKQSTPDAAVSKPSPQPSPSGRGGKAGVLIWTDRQLGSLSQNISKEVGDFTLRRADGCWAYQLAVVVDDAAQGINHVVRGLDLLDNTPRQILLQAALNLPMPQYLHTPLVLAADGQKLSKQNGAAALNSSSPAQCLANLHAAAQALGLPAQAATTGQGVEQYLNSLIAPWRSRWAL